MKFGLFFERFLNRVRKDLPDIDIDFEDTRREEIIQYLLRKYGSDHVAQISTFQTTGPKNAIRDAARYIGLDEIDLNGLLRFVSNESSLLKQLDSNHFLRNRIYSSTRSEHIFNLATKIEELPRNVSTHASGLVVSSLPLVRKIPLFNLANGRIQTQFTMKELEQFGLIKIDLLGLKTLSLLREIVTYALRIYGKEIVVNKIPDGERGVFKMLTDGITFKIFQLDSQGMRRCLNEVKIDNFEDLVNILALYRPGPIREIKTYASRKLMGFDVKGEGIGYEHILKSTYGVLIFQEQVMQICSEFCGLSPSQADILRRAISKKNYEVVNNFSKILRNNLKEKGVSFANINNVISLISRFAAYGFNKAHAVAYAILTYRSAYLK